MLSAIAETTKGEYFYASDQTRLNAIYAELDKLEQIQFESRTYAPKRRLFHFPLGLAIAVMVLFISHIAVKGIRERSQRSRA